MNKFVKRIQKPIHFLLYRLFMRSFLRLFFGMSYPRSNPLRGLSQVIIVANHNSHLDTVAVLSALPTSLLTKVYPVAARDYFGTNKLIRLFTEFFANILIVSRKKTISHKNALEDIGQLLADGHSILIFPEGSRGTADILQDFKHGTAFLLKKYPLIPFVPIFMKGMGKALPKGDPVIVPVECHIMIGKPVWIENIDQKEIADITDIIKQCILQQENSFEDN